MEQRRLGPELQRLHHLIKRRIGEVLSDGETRELTQMQSFVIRYLSEHQDKGDLFQRDLEKRFGIQRATATGILQLMEREGLIRREPVEYDARLKKLILTPEAKELDDHVISTIHMVEEQTLEGIAPEDLEVFWRVLEQMKKNLA